MLRLDPGFGRAAADPFPVLSTASHNTELLAPSTESSAQLDMIRSVLGEEWNFRCTCFPILSLKDNWLTVQFHPKN